MDDLEPAITDPWRIRRVRALDLGDVDRFRTLGSGLLLIGDLGTLGQRAVAVAVDSREMNKEVATAIVGRDEPETLVVT
jgi:hypothetical protein